MANRDEEPVNPNPTDLPAIPVPEPVPVPVEEINRSADVEDIVVPGCSGASRDKPPSRETVYNLLSDIMHREHGLRYHGRISQRHGFLTGLERRYFVSHPIVEKMTEVFTFYPGSGNYHEKAFNFNKAGNLLCCTSNSESSSKVQIWNLVRRKLETTYYPGPPRGKVTDLKFVPSGNNINIVSCNVEGDVNMARIQPNGVPVLTGLISTRGFAASKLALCPNPFLVLCAGADGIINLCDLREDDIAVELKVVKESEYLVKLFSIDHHPLGSELCVGCNDNKVRVYDIRHMTNAVHKMCPEKYIDRRPGKDYDFTHCTAVYNSTGSEILGSYSCDGHYLFNNKEYTPGSYINYYRGHFPEDSTDIVNNPSTGKFFGLNSEYVIGSSEYGSICFWDKDTAKVIAIEGEHANEEKLETHPSLPLIASWQRPNRNAVRIWQPTHLQVFNRGKIIVSALSKVE